MNSDSTIEVDEFNKFFSDIAETIIKMLPVCDLNYSKLFEKIPTTLDSFFLEPISAHDVILAVISLKNSKAIDIFEINTEILKNTIDLLALD